MSVSHPELKDYVALFEAYGRDLGALYQEPDDDRYALLFEQVIRLLVRPSQFNNGLPRPFSLSAQRYAARDPATVAHLSDPANRHFMLCDLHDLIMLTGGLALKRQRASGKQ